MSLALTLRTVNKITMTTKTEKFCCSCKAQSGFSLIEILIVVAILSLAAAIAVPNLSAALERIKLRGGAQELAQLYQETRMRAVQDDSYYEVLVAPALTGAYADVNGNGTTGTIVLQLPAGMSLNNSNPPAGLNLGTLGFNPVLTENSVMFDQDGVNRPGLAWSSRGTPCQRSSATSLCQTGFGWLQYVQYQTGNDISYAAVSVSPAGRTRVWLYRGGVWR